MPLIEKAYHSPWCAFCLDAISNNTIGCVPASPWLEGIDNGVRLWGWFCPHNQLLWNLWDPRQSFLQTLFLVACQQKSLSEIGTTFGPGIVPADRYPKYPSHLQDLHS